MKTHTAHMHTSNHTPESGKSAGFYGNILRPQAQHPRCCLLYYPLVTTGLGSVLVQERVWSGPNRVYSTGWHLKIPLIKSESGLMLCICLMRMIDFELSTVTTITLFPNTTHLNSLLCLRRPTRNSTTCSVVEWLILRHGTSYFSWKMFALLSKVYCTRSNSKVNLHSRIGVQFSL